MTLRPRRHPRAATALVGLAMLLLVGCGVNPQPTDYGQEYRENFMLGCTGVGTEGDVPEGGEELASRSVCECIYDGLVERVPFDEAKDFEDQQSEAESGEDIEVPDNIQRIIDDCAEPS